MKLLFFLNEPKIIANGPPQYIGERTEATNELITQDEDTLHSPRNHLDTSCSTELLMSRNMILPSSGCYLQTLKVHVKWKTMTLVRYFSLVIRDTMKNKTRMNEIIVKRFLYLVFIGIKSLENFG